MCVDALLFTKWLDICLSMERNEFLFSLCLYTQLLLAFLNSHYFYPQISIFPLSCGRGDLGWLGVWLLARVIPPQSFLVPNVWPEITTALIQLCAVAVVAVNWQDSVLVMEFACFTVYLKLEASGHFWILLFSGLLITLFCCACDHVDKKKKRPCICAGIWPRHGSCSFAGWAILRMRDYTSLLVFGIGVPSFVAWASEVFVDLYKAV